MFPLATTVWKKKETSSAINSFRIPVTHTAAETVQLSLCEISYVYTAIVQYMGGDIRWKVSKRDKEKLCIL